MGNGNDRRLGAHCGGRGRKSHPILGRSKVASHIVFLALVLWHSATFFVPGAGGSSDFLMLSKSERRLGLERF